MSVGAFAAYNFQLRLPWLPLLVTFVLAGVISAAGGRWSSGSPRCASRASTWRWRRFAAQFFVDWLFTKVGWFSNYSELGVITAQRMVIVGVPVRDPGRGATSWCSRS